MQVTCVFHVRILLLHIVKDLQINDKAKYIYMYLALLLTCNYVHSFPPDGKG